MVPGTEIELGEEASPVELIQQLVNHWDRKFVLGGLGVEGAVVNKLIISINRINMGLKPP
jgi:hypothetical protein